MGGGSGLEGGNHGGDDNNGLNGKLIGAVVAVATVAVGSAIAVMFGPSESLSGILSRTNTQTTSDKDQMPFKDSISCLTISKRLAQCLETNDYNIKKCSAYYDLLKECENSE